MSPVLVRVFQDGKIQRRYRDTFDLSVTVPRSHLKKALPPEEEDESSEPTAFEQQVEVLALKKTATPTGYCPVPRMKLEREQLDECPYCDHVLSGGFCPNCGYESAPGGDHFMEIDCRNASRRMLAHRSVLEPDYGSIYRNKGPHEVMFTGDMSSRDDVGISWVDLDLETVVHG